MNPEGIADPISPQKTEASSEILQNQQPLQVGPRLRRGGRPRPARHLGSDRPKENSGLPPRGQRGRPRMQRVKRFTYS